MKETKPSKAPKASKASLVLAVEINQDWRYYTAEEQIEVPTAGQTLVRVGSMDYSALTVGGERQLADAGKRLVRAKAIWVRSGKRVHFTPESQRTLAGRPVIPVGELIGEHIPDKTTSVILRLPLVDELEALAVYRRNGEIGGWTVVRQEDIQISADRLIQDSGLGEAPLLAMPRVFTLEGMQPGAAKPYPVENEWKGIKVRKIKQGVALGAIALGVLGVTDWISGSHEYRLAHSQALMAQNRVSGANIKLIEWDREHAMFLAHKGTMDVGALIKAAQQVAIPGGDVQLTNDGTQIVVYLPKVAYPNLVRGIWVQPNRIGPWMERPAPEGWRFSEITRAGGGGALAYVYEKTQKGALNHAEK